MDRRFARGAFFGAWLLLFGAQLAALSQFPQDETTLTSTVVGMGAVVALLQLLKLPITAWRLNDIGRPASDALFFCLLPVANIVGLLRFMPEATPGPKAWERRRAGWSNQIGPIAALGQAIPLTLKSWPVLLPVATVYGVVMAAGGVGSLNTMGWASANPTERALLANALAVFAGILGIYTMVQFTKRDQATRVSWLPALFFLPTLLLALAFTFFEQGETQQLQLMLIMLIYSAWQMLWMSIGGAAVVVAATLCAEQVRGEGLDPAKTFGQLIGRTMDVAGPHGFKVQAITIGMQVLIPGIFYMLQLAFADSIAVLKPQAAALKNSGKLTWGMRGRLFKLFLAMTLIFMVLHFMLVAGLDSSASAMAYYMDVRAVSFPVFAAGEVLWGVYVWLLQVSLLVIYHDRVRYLKERKAERAARKQAKAAAPAGAEQPV